MNFAVFPLWLFLGALMVAPQNWYGPVLNLRVDLVIYPLWMLVLALRGRLVEVFRFTAQDWLLVAMLCWFVLSHLANGASEPGAERLTNYAKWFVLYRMVVASIDTPRNLHRAALALLFFGLVLTVEGVQHKFSPDGLGWAGQSFGWTDPAAAEIGLETRTRWVGIFDGPGVFCVVYTIALPFALTYTSAAYGMLTRLLAAGVLVPGLLLATYYTGSRGGMLTAAAICWLYVASRFRISLKKFILFSALGAASLTLAPSYLTSTRDESHSAQNRVSVWASGMSMTADNPLFGVGKGNYHRYSSNGLIAHNSGIETMGETGFPGLFLWFCVLLAALRQLQLSHSLAEDPAERQLLLAVGLALVGYFISSLFVTLEYETYYCLLALAASARNWSRPAPFTRRDFWTALAVMAGFVGVFRVFVVNYW